MRSCALIGRLAVARGTRGAMSSASGAIHGGNSASRIVYDGKRMRKAVIRKTVDFNGPFLKELELRTLVKAPSELPYIRNTPNHVLDYLFPRSYSHNQSQAVTMHFIHTSVNKARCPINVVRWSPEGKRLIAGNASGEFTLWNGLQFNFETIQQSHDAAVRCMQWNHSGSWMLSGDHAGIVKVWMPNMNNLNKIAAHKEPVRDISFSPTDAKFATCSDDGSIKIWDFSESIEERCLTGHGWDVKNVQWHPYRSLLASGSKDNLVKLWDAKSGINVATVHGHRNTILDVKWNRNGNWLATAGRDQMVRIFDVRTLRELQTLRGHRREIMSLSWHPHLESLFCSGGTDGSIFFWNVGQEAPISCLEAAHDAIVWCMDWHPVGHILATGSNDNTTRFWTRARPGDQFNDKFAIGKAASEALGVRDIERFGGEDDDDAMAAHPSEDSFSQPASNGGFSRHLPGLSRLHRS